MDTCVLSVSEAARLEHYGIWPKCKAHRHIKRREALIGIADDTYRTVGGCDTSVESELSMVVPTNLEGRTWVNRTSGGPLGFTVKQFVRAV